MTKELMIKEFNRKYTLAYAQAFGFKMRMKYQEICRRTGLYELVGVNDRTKPLKPKNYHKKEHIKIMLDFLNYSYEIIEFDHKQREILRACK